MHPLICQGLYLAIITSYKVVLARTVTFKMAALCFVNVTKEVINTIRKNSIPKSTNDSTEVHVKLISFKEKKDINFFAD